MGGSITGMVLEQLNRDWTRREGCLLLLSGLAALWVIGSIRGSSAIKAPIIGYKSWLEPTWFLALRFSFTSKETVYEGYTKVINSNRKYIYIYIYIYLSRNFLDFRA